MTTQDRPASVPAEIRGAHHAADGTFRNPWPDSEPRGWRDVLRWRRQRRGQVLATDPPRGSFPTARPEISHPRAPATTYSATWIGHSTVLLQFGGLNILTDPMFSQRAFPVQWAGPRRIMDPALDIGALPPLDIILLSHTHYDHLDKAAVRRIARAHPNATWVVPLGVGAYIRGWGAREIGELDWWQQSTIGALRVTATPARHFSARRLGDRNKTLWCGFAFELAGRRVLFAGDTAYHDQFRQVGERCGPFDFVMIPIGAYDPRWFMHVVHVDPEEAVQIYQDLVAPHAERPLPLMLAIHWGTFRLTDEGMDEPPRRTTERWRAVGLADDRLWIARFGETRSV
ncbi:MAG TPA: MBL fold metallo-hydrolase [Gemmatimonadaceae bacterium]|jgi:N-acyl-phosphatidylethanolamine-hydrolysing phospholipase D